MRGRNPLADFNYRNKLKKEKNMKKVFVMISFAAILGLTSCGNASTNEVSTSDSTAVDSTKVSVDTTKVADTTAVADTTKK